MNREVLSRSIVIIGPVGTGKSLTSWALGRQTGMPVITTDLLRHCPKTIAEIDSRQQKVKERISQLKAEIEVCPDENIKKDLEQELKRFRNDDWVCDRQREMRKLLPKVSNYKEMGFNGDVSNFANKFGEVAWHFYQKQFENRMLTCIVEQLSTPAIVDMGGGMAVSLDDDYKQVAKLMSKKYPEEYKKYMDTTQIGFNIIQRELAKCPTVVNLVLPKDYKNMSKASGNQGINDKFIASGQFQKLATVNIPVDGLIVGDTYNPDVLNQIVGKIQASKDKGM